MKGGYTPASLQEKALNETAIIGIFIDLGSAVQSFANDELMAVTPGKIF